MDQMESLDAFAHLGPGKRTRLHRLLHQFGPGRGTMLLLPYDQGLEHGPVDFFDHPRARDPEYVFELALEGGFSGVAMHVGLARKHYSRFAGRIPLVLKLNGKTSLPERAFSPMAASVEEAVALGADAIGYTLYVGSPDQGEDIRQFRDVRLEADRLGIPTIVWAYPRGPAVESKGGMDGLYAVDYAARVADELGADLVKVNPPAPPGPGSPEPYSKLTLDLGARMRKVVESAGRTRVLFSGGSRIGEADLFEKARLCMSAGATGLIFGRNLWQRPREEALRVSARMREILAEHGEPGRR